MKKIIELAFLRNRLASKKYDISDEQLMEKIKQEILKMDTPFKDLALNAIRNCENDIKNADFDHATQEIQLIHNFTFFDSNSWNSDYFYRVEFLSYCEQINDVKRVKKLICFLAEIQSKL